MPPSKYFRSWSKEGIGIQMAARKAGAALLIIDPAAMVRRNIHN
jgi:hypothetical protein